MITFRTVIVFRDHSESPENLLQGLVNSVLFTKGEFSIAAVKSTYTLAAPFMK